MFIDVRRLALGPHYKLTPWLLPLVHVLDLKVGLVQRLLREGVSLDHCPCLLCGQSRASTLCPILTSFVASDIMMKEIFSGLFVYYTHVRSMTCHDHANLYIHYVLVAVNNVTLASIESGKSARVQS